MTKKISLLIALLFILGVGGYAQDADATDEVDLTADSDFDGMPDWWETEHGFVTRRDMGAEARRDNDGDLINNISEFSNSTDPNDASDNDGDGIPDDYETHYGFDDPDDDLDDDGVSNMQEYEDRTDPSDPEDFVVVVTVVESDERGTPSMEGVTENKDESLLENNHEVSPGVFVFNDPIGDDKGPGYYSYPTLAVYAPGAFDIVQFKVDTTDSKNVIFEIKVNADLKQDWGMAADFDVQHFQIYIDQDREAGSGATGSEGGVVTLPGLNCFISPFDGWDYVVLVTPQPDARVQVEIDVKAPDVVDNCIIPTKISGNGRTVTVIVSKKELMGSSATEEDYDFSQWAYQVFAQSNEGYPDPEDLLTRNVNEFKGLHRFGGGSDYWGDPEFMDILVYPAIGSLEEAENQFKILNVWSSYPDPTLDVKAVVPMFSATMDELWEPEEGYEEYAIELASKIAPPTQKDKYVSDNFTFSGSVNAQWLYNMDNASVIKDWGETYLPSGPAEYYNNTINSRFTLEFYGKAFTDYCNFYARLESYWNASSRWDNWIHEWDPIESDTRGPGYVPIEIQSFRFQLVNPVPTVDYISIGNYDVNYSAWTAGAASYPDRDKFKGIFIDGSTEKWNFAYSAGLFYPFNWLGIDWALGDYTAKDFVAAYDWKIEPVSILSVENSLSYYRDTEVGELDTNSGLTGLAPRLRNLATIGKIGLDIGDIATLDVLGGYSVVWRGTNLAKNAPNSGTGVGIPAGTTDIFGYMGVATLQMNSIGGSGLSFTLQGFWIDRYYSIMAARGDYANAASHDVLEMYGNQSASAYGQDAASYQKYGNEMWESTGFGMWKGVTAMLDYNGGVWNLHAEFTPFGFNNTNWVVVSPSPEYKTNTPSAMRAYASFEYKLDIGGGLNIEADILWNKTQNWWPLTAPSIERRGMSAYTVGDFKYGFDYMSFLPGITLTYQVSKLFSVNLGYEHRYDIIEDLTEITTYSDSTAYDPIYKVSEEKIIAGFEYSTPLGIFRTRIVGYMVQNPRNVAYGGTLDEDWRAPTAYLGKEYNIVAHTELDVHF